MIAERYRAWMHGLIESVLREIGPRESCGEAEQRFGAQLIEQWRAFGHEAHAEPFTCHPKAFLGFIPIASGLYLLASGAYWFAPLLALLFATFAAAMVFFELLRYREFVDRWFDEATGENAVAVIKPKGEPLRRVVVSAHRDSAYEFNLWYFLKTASIPIMVLAFAAPFYLSIASLLAGLGVVSPESSLVMGYVALGLYPFVGLNFFFHTYSVVPGAMDDLAGVSVVSAVGKWLAEEGNLEHTEVVLLATSAEECGLRGAKRYASQHRAELHAIPSYGLFVDGVYDERFLTVVDRELTTGARHSPALVDLAHRVAGERGFPIRKRMIPFGGSDAAAFSTAGIPSVVLLCQDLDHLVPNYHTRLDTLEHVRAESLVVTLQVVIDMIQAIDREAP